VLKTLIDLMVSNSDFIEAILCGTSEPDKVRKRFHLVQALVDDILQSYKQQPRCFSGQLKKNCSRKMPVVLSAISRSG
jgi:hypothetical protein